MEESKKPTYKLYSLAEILIATYFGGPLVAGIFAGQNYINLGEKKSGIWAIIIGIISTILIIIGIFAIPENIISKIPSILIPLIYTGIIYFFIKNLQGDEIEEHKKNNGEFYSVWTVIGISLICAIILAGVFFGIAYLLPESTEKNNTSLSPEITEKNPPREVENIPEKNNTKPELNAKPIKPVKYGNPIKDQDGNIYKTVIIGTQTWMFENLKTTRFNDGKPIRLVTDNNAWDKLTTSGYCWYNNDAVNYKATYGALYNWYAVGTGNLCPVGWHVPSDKEWIKLITFLGGEDIAGSKMKEAGIMHWDSLNTDATNESGFTALPGGFRFSEDSSAWMGSGGEWWTSTKISSREWGWTTAYTRVMESDSRQVRQDTGFGDLTCGLSVRCVKDYVKN